ncbi:hypothetical protein Fmac_009793 [Flemingia macrophylla]|uniref:Uncharacterized protein n=1 Tax=Flemingia macrophylla TaxID=520843 RepID=A0ABD1N2I2_9FABA
MFGWPLPHPAPPLSPPDATPAISVLCYHCYYCRHLFLRKKIKDSTHSRPLLGFVASRNYVTHLGAEKMS